MLQVKNLTKIYDGGVKALDNVSFEVPKGQFLAVIGLSGSGKSTLLRCINRLIEPTAGQILWDGEDIIAATPEEMRRIAQLIGQAIANTAEDESVKARLRQDVRELSRAFPLYPDFVDEAVAGKR